MKYASMWSPVWSAGALLLSAAMLAGCGGGNSGAEADASVSAATAQASEANNIADSMTSVQVTNSGGAVTDIARVSPDSISGCPAIDVKSTGSGGAWTDEVLTFANPPCSFTGARGYDTLAITGSVELTRSDTSGLAFNSSVQNLEFAFSTLNATYSETRNGTRMVTASPSIATSSNNISVVFVGALHSGTLTHTLTAGFTPASGMQLAAGEPLPNGTFDFSGNANWVGSDGNSDTFSVVTVTPLAYDSACTDTEPSVFSSGQVNLHGSKDSANAYASVVWSNCQAPTITYVP
jgi:hypothetical protein